MKFIIYAIVAILILYFVKRAKAAQLPGSQAVTIPETAPGRASVPESTSSSPTGINWMSGKQVPIYNRPVAVSPGSHTGKMATRSDTNPSGANIVADLTKQGYTVTKIVNLGLMSDSDLAKARGFQAYDSSTPMGKSYLFDVFFK
jgi:hypothetical protein